MEPHRTPARIPRAVLTIALGRPVYVEMACTLARSFRRWHADSDIAFALVTDRPDLIPPDLDVTVLPVASGQLGYGFSPKLKLDVVSPADRTLFVDADCLILGSLEPVFTRFAGRAVSVVGQSTSSGEWFGDIERRCALFDVPSVPKFVGALYYFEAGEVAECVFQTARDLEARYDDIGMVRLRGMPNEEPLVSLAMALHGQAPLEDDGTVKADAMHFPDKLRVDALAGYAHFRNRTGRRMTTSPDFSEAHPLIAHFNASFAEGLPYTREALRLRRHSEGRPRAWLELEAFLLRTVPAVVTTTVKRVLRPAYRRVFGVRRVKVSPRIAERIHG